MTPTRLQEILSRAFPKRILVIGDLMLDEFVWGKVGRISPEAPVPVVEVTGESFYPGGAANVARNAAALGASPCPSIRRRRLPPRPCSTSP
jgi:D-beta-D-heptose 7-phosphate kinase/D-beta-D-heptose 1-phosphate adenosyltransferase